MLGELKSVQRSRLRHDGYASDSAVLDDEDDIWTISPVSGQVRYIHFFNFMLIKSPKHS